jgi:hypothetical protein
MSHYASASLSLHSICTLPQTDSNERIRSMAKAGIEVMEQKFNVWNERLILCAAYLDPKLRLQLTMLTENCRYLTKNKVFGLIRLTIIRYY